MELFPCLFCVYAFYVCIFVQSSRPRYIQRSKSHDDPHADIHAPAGTARGRIARQGARMVRSRSPSSSPVGTPKAHSPPLKKGYPTDSPAEVAVTYMPAATSPPQSAQSLKEEKSFFRYSFKKKSSATQNSKEKSDNDSIKSPISPSPRYPMSPPAIGPLSPSAKNPISPLPESPLTDTPNMAIVTPQSRFMNLANTTPKSSHNVYSPTNPFVSLAHDKYDKPKPLVASPDKKAHNRSLVQSRIQMFTMPERKSGSNEKKTDNASSFSPPPIPPRQHEIAQSQSEQDSEPGGALKGANFMSRNRQRPFSPPAKQKAVHKLLHELPVSESSAFHVPFPKSPATEPAPHSEYMNPFLSRSQSPDKSSTSQDNESIKQSYVSRCSSDESLTEYTSLLKEDDKSSSRSSICIYFDGKDIPDTLV